MVVGTRRPPRLRLRFGAVSRDRLVARPGLTGRGFAGTAGAARRVAGPIEISFPPRAGFVRRVRARDSRSGASREVSFPFSAHWSRRAVRRGHATGRSRFGPGVARRLHSLWPTRAMATSKPMRFFAGDPARFARVPPGGMLWSAPRSCGTTGVGRPR